MVSCFLLSTTVAFILAGPGLAGPCTQRLADLEKSISARQEGAGPTLDAPATTGSAVQGTTPGQGPGANVAGQNQEHNQAMQMMQQAKPLDQQGKEAECMDMVGRIGATATPAAK